MQNSSGIEDGLQALQQGKRTEMKIVERLRNSPSSCLSLPFFVCVPQVTAICYVVPCRFPRSHRRLATPVDRPGSTSESPVRPAVICFRLAHSLYFGLVIFDCYSISLCADGTYLD